MQPVIIPVASGKGGVGKSLLTANIAISLVKKGFKVIAIDLDLGGSNLHSYLGIPNKYPGIGDFLMNQSLNLDELVLNTDIENLSFIAGDGRTPCMANIAYSEKVRLLLAIKWLKADYVLLDLSAGSSFNTLDFFALAPLGLMVTTLEYPAIMNMLVYLRNFIFRAFDRELKGMDQVALLLQNFRRLKLSRGQMTIGTMIEQLKVANPKAAEKAKIICNRYRPRVVYNMCISSKQMNIIKKIELSAKNMLNIELGHIGSVFEDRHARESSFRNVPLLLNYPNTLIAQRINELTQMIIDTWQKPVIDSADLLISNTKFFAQTHGIDI